MASGCDSTCFWGPGSRRSRTGTTVRPWASLSLKGGSLNVNKTGAAVTYRNCVAEYVDADVHGQKHALSASTSGRDALPRASNQALPEATSSVASPTLPGLGTTPRGSAGDCFRTACLNF